MNDIINLAQVPKSGLIVELRVLQGAQHVARAVSSKKAVYTAGSGMVTRVVHLESPSTNLVILDKCEALALAVSGDPVVLVAHTVNSQGLQELLTLKVSKLLILDQPLLDFTITTTGISQLDLNYQT